VVRLVVVSTDGRHHNEHVGEVSCHCTRVERAISLIEDHNDNIVSDVALAGQSLGVVVFVRQEAGHVVADLHALKIRLAAEKENASGVRFELAYLRRGVDDCAITLVQAAKITRVREVDTLTESVQEFLVG
jgi:hypothetical protein